MAMRFCQTTFSLVLAFLMASSFNEVRADQPQVSGSIQAVPSALRLIHHRQEHSLTINGRTADGFAVDLSKAATMTSADPSVAAVENGWVRPLKSGQTQITVQASGQTVQVPVMVELPAVERPYSFRHEVMPVLSKGGCNMGACHGYSLGKNGFKLSLRGGEAVQDYQAVFGDQFGRRVNLLKPSESLLLTKPIGDVPHRGGIRIAKDSLSQKILQTWIEQGAKSDFDDKSEVEFVRIFPERFVLEPGMSHHLQLVAHYTDGTTRDVTKLAIFNVNTDGVAEVTDIGHVTARELGESAVVARFERKFAAARLIVLNRKPDFQPTPIPTEHFIDQHVVAKLNDLKVIPSELSNDEEFLRRVSLDLIGLQPTAEEVRKFLADADPAKRAKTIDALFGRPEFVDHWSLKWGDLLQNSRVRVSEPAMYGFREWIRSAVSSNMPLDEMTRQLLTSKGGAADNPAGAYFLISKDTNDTLERVAEVFCGVRMLCARCHTHPFENWTQEDYFGLNSFFNQVTAKADPRMVGVPNARSVSLQLATGFATNPRSGQAQPPRFLGGIQPPASVGTDRRVQFATWLTAADNPMFARSLANRFWSYFFSRGIVDPVDDLRTTNPPINPELLDALTKDFIEHRFDVRHLMRRIVTSQTYQRSSLANDSNRHDTQNFSHALPRRIPAEALLDSLVQATGVRENFGGAPAGFSAAQLPDAEINSDFLSLFGKPQRADACECERDGDSNMLQALHLINGQSILRRVTDPNGRVAQLLKQTPPLTEDQLIEDLYLWSLARRPTAKEIELAKKHFATYGDQQPPDATQDLMWSLLNSRDFLLVR
ncbi:MAG: DUF1549 and DUF1553 domain-containing protein [Planctomycetia bacterium]|nr:DUF1549 and DUF1553 domain-containing protein [Planctomycetia bacterium]